MSETESWCSYNRYLAVAARVVRRSLKEQPRLQAEKRGEMDLRFAKWEVRHRELRQSAGYDSGIELADGGLQNGKQGDNQNLASANAASMAQNAGGSGQ